MLLLYRFDCPRLVTDLFHAGEAMIGARFLNDLPSSGRFRNFLVVVAAALVLFACCVAAHAQSRVALVIGNGDYRNTSKLSNPRNDATDVAAALQRIGFTTIVGFDLDKAGMEDAEVRFTRAARDADVALFYYSGHAIQYAATNYLLPVDAQIKDAADLRRLTKVDDIVADLQQAKELRIMVLDSCRDNPLADVLKRERSGSVQRGLARLSTSQGMIVAYSTLAGQTADDGQGRNSPYTAAFLRQIETQEEISTVFKRVSAEVYEKTDRRQIPELSLSVFKDFYLRGRTGTPSAIAPPSVSGAGPKPSIPSLPAIATIPPADQLGTFQNRFTLTTTQRVVLHDEDPSDPKGKQYVGSVIWRTEPIKASGNQKADISVRADIEIPDRKFKMTMSFRRNTDTSLPASHTAELTFILPPDFSGGGVSNVPGILMKSNEQARGTPLAGLAVKVTDGFFLVGLSNFDSERVRNLQLLEERSWFDIPLVYVDQRRANIAIEKGAPGERAFADAFIAWQQTPSTDNMAQEASTEGTAPEDAGSYLVYVVSGRTEQGTRAEFRAMRDKFPSVLGSRLPRIERVDRGDKGIIYRAGIPFKTTDEASRFCRSLISSGGHCATISAPVTAKVPQ